MERLGSHLIILYIRPAYKVTRSEDNNHFTTIHMSSKCCNRIVQWTNKLMVQMEYIWTRWQQYIEKAEKEEVTVAIFADKCIDNYYIKKK